MAQLKINFMSYALGYPVNIDTVLPSFSSCDMDPGKERSHKVRAKYPILYLLHGHRKDVEDLWICFSLRNLPKPET